VSANVMTFNRGVVRPLECLQTGWGLIKDRYWLFMGITAVGLLIGSLGPLGILLGPMMCGIYLCLLARMRGEMATFELLFKGFDYFAQSVIATLIHVIPMFLMLLPVYAIFFIQFMSKMERPRGRGRPAPVDPSELYTMFATMGVLILVVMLVGMIIGAFLIFTYPLIVDRRLAALDAIKTSIKAALANLGGVMGLIVLNFILSIIGMLFCYVGAFLVLPISFAALAVAYRQVFPAET
jgi:hypothetical protein